MLIKKMSKIFKIICAVNFFLISNVFSNEINFDSWLKDFKSRAITYGVSEKVVEDVLSDAKFLPKVIQYDRYQPEFYEDTFTYIEKRSSKKKN